MMLKHGSRLGPYEVVAFLGKGGMGEVYRARDPRLRREVAIKVLASAPDAQHLHQFEEEARAAAGTNHPNILVIYDFAVHDGQPYVVSELLEGETLRAKLARGPLSLKRVIDYASQIASGLAAAHDHGIVHRDLKPANLFVTTEGRIKILDFGLAKLLPTRQPIDDASTVLADQLAAFADAHAGTPRYMSPEQKLGGRIDHRSDIFAFGLVLYEMLTGRGGLESLSEVGRVSAVPDEEPLVPAGLQDVPPDIQRIVARCLEHKPGNRFQSTRDLCFTLTLEFEALHAASRGRSPAASQWRLAAAAALALIAVALVLGMPGGTRVAPVATPLYQQLTFRRGTVLSARFAGDGDTIVYGAAWGEDTPRLWATRPQSPESRQLPLGGAGLMAISRSGEMAVLLERRPGIGMGAGGMLARLPLDGSAPREVLMGVEDADWAPDGENLAVVRVAEGKHRLEFPIGAVLVDGTGRISNVRVSPDGKRVAFVDRPLFEADDRGSVCVIGISDRTKKVLSAGWSSVSGLAWAPRGDEIWFTAAAFGAAASLHGVNLSGRVRSIASSARRMALLDIDPAGRVLMTEGSFRLRIGDVGTPPSGEQDLSWLDASVLTEVSADGTTLLINEAGAGGGTPLYAVYVRKSDGSPAIRIGDGASPTLSMDGRWVAALLLRSPPSIALLPTGAGQPRMLRAGALADYQAVKWLPDGRRLLLAGSEAGRSVRLWTMNVDDGSVNAVSKEGLRIASFGRPISPDGHRVVAVDGTGRLWVNPLNGAEAPRPIAGLEPGHLPIGWHIDGRSIYVFRDGELPAIIHRVHLDDGRQEPIAEVAPADAAGVRAPATVVATADGSRFFYSYVQELSDLFLVEGLR